MRWADGWERTESQSTWYIPLFGADIKLAGSLSLAVSLPTMIVGFARYSRDQASRRCDAIAGLWGSWQQGRSPGHFSAHTC